jgi:hypothetical protein
MVGGYMGEEFKRHKGRRRTFMRKKPNWAVDSEKQKVGKNLQQKKPPITLW